MQLDTLFEQRAVYAVQSFIAGFPTSDIRGWKLTWGGKEVQRIVAAAIYAANTSSAALNSIEKYCINDTNARLYIICENKQ